MWQLPGVRRETSKIIVLDDFFSFHSDFCMCILYHVCHFHLRLIYHLIETGSGKSLLVFRVFQLVLGEKVSPTIMRGSSFASGEIGKKISCSSHN